MYRRSRACIYACTRAQPLARTGMRMEIATSELEFEAGAGDRDRSRARIDEVARVRDPAADGDKRVDADAACAA